MEQRLRPIARRYLGVREVPLDRIVGTEGRAGAFTRKFEPRHRFSRDRLRSLASAFPDGGFPPIVAVKLGDTLTDAFPSCGCPPLEETLPTVVADAGKRRRLGLFRRD